MNITYAVRIIRTNNDTGQDEKIEWDGYVLLRELWDEIEAEATRRGWFEDDAEDAAT